MAIYGEAPGRNENFRGEPFIGKAGAVLDLNLGWHGIDRGSCWVSNVCHYWPGAGTDGKDLHPTPEDLARDRPAVLQELRLAKPKVVIALGTFATEWFLGPGHDIHTVNGIPHLAGSLQKDFPGLVVVPVVHPAAGLHEPKSAAWTWLGIRAASRFLKGKLEVWQERPTPTDFTEIKLFTPTPITSRVAVDTEGSRTHPWCVSVCGEGGGWVVRAANAHHLRLGGDVIFHNGSWDAQILEAMKVGLPAPSRWDDTMLMAHAVGETRIGLKSLAYRYLGIKMESFEKLVLPHCEEAARAYTREIAVRTWPKVAPSLVFDQKKGRWREYQPQALDTKAWRVSRGTASALDWLKDLSTQEWAMVVQELGPIPTVSLDLVPLKKAIQYAGLDAWATYHLYPILKAQVAEGGLSSVYEHDRGLMSAVTEMETTGLPFDVKKMEEVDADFEVRESHAQEVVVQLSGNPNFNPRSPAQVGAVLSRMGAVGRRRTASGGESSDERTLEALRAKKKAPRPLVEFVESLLDFRGWAKLRSTYSLKLPTHVRDGRIYPHLSITNTVSGRFSSDEPNLQNIPSRDEAGMKIRSCFVAPEGYVLLACDLSQIELRLGAHLSQDPTMIEVFKRGEDLHEKTRRSIYHDHPHLDDPAHADSLRKRAKTANFSVLYGITPGGLSSRFLQMGVQDMDELRCARLIRDWFQVYPGVRRYLEACGRAAKKQGFVSTEAGRRRFLPLARLVQHPAIEAEAVRQAGNHTIQGTASEILKRGIHRWVLQTRDGCNKITDTRLLLQIHDELLFMVKGTLGSKKVARVAAMVKEMLEAESAYRVPIIAECKVGLNWGEMEKLK